jgi:hypothetical protein
MPDDDIEREIKDILDKLDKFVPEESAAGRFSKRTAHWASDLQRAVVSRLASISLSQVMLVALAMIVLGWLFGMRVNPVAARWVIIAGIILLGVSFVASLRSSRTAHYEKRWRGQVIDLSGPSLADRLRAWFRRGRNPRR